MTTHLRGYKYPKFGLPVAYSSSLLSSWFSVIQVYVDSIKTWKAKAPKSKPGGSTSSRNLREPDNWTLSLSIPLWNFGLAVPGKK